MSYGPLNYYSLGRVYPQTLTRSPLQRKRQLPQLQAQTPIIENAVVSSTASCSISATSNVVHNSNFATHSSPSMSAVGNIIQSFQSSFQASSSFTPTGSVQRSATASLASTASSTPTGSVQRGATASLASTASFTPTGFVQRGATASLASTASLIVTINVVHNGEIAIHSSSSMSVVGNAVQSIQSIQSLLQASSSVTSTGFVQKSATASLTSIASLTAITTQETFTILNIGYLGDTLDMTGVIFPEYPITRKRQRIIPAGEGIDDVMSLDVGLAAREIHSPYPGTRIGDLALISNIASGYEATIASYTVPASKTFYLLGVVAHGNIHSTFRIYLEADVIHSGKTTVVVPTYCHNSPHALFTADAGDTVSLKTIHDSSGTLGEFEGTILGYVL